MKLQEIFDQLGNGEFSQLCIGGQAPGVIDENNYSKVIGHLNLALTALYKRFTLKEGQLILQLQSDQVKYKLHSSFAVNVRRSLEPVRYIIDTADEPFADDILKVEKVLTDDEFVLPLNDQHDEYSVITPTMTSLRVPTCMVTAGLETPTELVTDNLIVVYRANHPKIVVGLGYFDPTRVDIELPESHVEALLYYIASRVQMPIGVGQEMAVSMTFAARFEQACLELEGKGLQIDQGGMNTRFASNGWA